MTEDKEKEIEQAPTTDQEQEPTEVESTGGAKSGGDDAATTTTGPSAPNEGTAGPAT